MTNGGGPGHGIKARQKSAAKKNKRRVVAATAKRKGWVPSALRQER